MTQPPRPPARPPNRPAPPPPPRAGLIFVAYCVVCYLVTALLFSLMILDLAALVLTVAPAKGIFKYTDLVYTGAPLWGWGWVWVCRALGLRFGGWGVGFGCGRVELGGAFEGWGGWWGGLSFWDSGRDLGGWL